MVVKIINKEITNPKLQTDDGIDVSLSDYEKIRITIARLEKTKTFVFCSLLKCIHTYERNKFGTFLRIVLYIILAEI